MAKRRVFRTDFTRTQHAVDPETLFRDLRARSPEIKHLWSHQADLLRDYWQRFRDAKDIAIELPTGAGKTLVGLLIAETRRRNFAERVAYLCPTRQLARQVGAHASKYGITAHVFVGRQRDYPPREFSEFQSSKAIAITTYSAIFNFNPRICDAQVLILDDAHASENYITGMWSVEIDRADSPELYRSIVGLLQGGLPSAFYADIIDERPSDEPRSRSVEVVPGSYVRECSSGLRDLLQESLKEETSSWYAWQVVRDHLHACVVFVSSDAILIRPLIPPALTHAAFNQANQRIYMSATLGAGGELERITGVNSIERLPIPAGWDERGSGRRLFLLPQVTLSDEEAMEVVLAIASHAPRILVLTPTQYEASQFGPRLTALGFKVLGAAEIEDSIDVFSAHAKSALVLSRYDGLDLPDETCRVLVMAGLPSGTNLQERFLWSRVAASSLLRDRVLTRFSQGVGRCTRSDSDYAVVVVWGRRLVDFILKQENRRILNAELQAELEFGLENSRDRAPKEFEELSQEFLEQGETWQPAEETIVNLRERTERGADTVSEQLRSVVSDEVSYLYSLWNRDYETSLNDARKVADALSGDETKGYRGWWYYLAADAALALREATGDGGLLDTAIDCLKRARTCCSVISCFYGLARMARGETGPATADEVTALAIEKMSDKLKDWGTVGSRFEKEVSQAIADLEAIEYKRFHRGLKALGEMLGFRAELFDGEGDPDCVWSIGSEVYIVHEAKSAHTPEGSISVNDVRQAQSHEDWIRNHRPCGSGTHILPVIESPRTMVSDKAVVYAKSLCHVAPEQMKAICEKIAAVLRKVRARACGLSDEKLLEYLHSEVAAAKLTPHDVVKRLSAEPVKNMPTT